MILGSICTRGCRFCSVGKGTPLPVDPEEPQRVAQAATQLGLRHVVITSVTRDDLPDGGAEHFYRTILAVRAATGASVEVLPSDFSGNLAAVDRVLEAAPDVYNYNCETVPRLYPVVRTAAASYRRTLAIFRHIARHSPAVRRKTGLMLGLGETVGELLDTLAELHEAGCQMLTLGQYLRPSPAQLPVARYVPPKSSTNWASWLGASATGRWPAARWCAPVIMPGRWSHSHRHTADLVHWPDAPFITPLRWLRRVPLLARPAVRGCQQAINEAVATGPAASLSSIVVTFSVTGARFERMFSSDPQAHAPSRPCSQR
jgi:Lipoate synthase